MPKIRTKRTKFPKGWDKVEETIRAFEDKMRDAELDPHDGKRRHEALWPIIRINHQRSRYIYNMYYRDEEISRKLYDFLLREGYADTALIAKWKKSGYERLCCLQCVQTQGTNFGTTCVCRVPKSRLEEGKVVECITCGCHGCASGDG